MYEIIIVGRGLIGTAAAKYISRTTSNVALIGPDEATTSRQQIVFASHYDRARIQRIVGKDEIETRLNFESAHRHQELQRESGIGYHSPEGCLLVLPEDDPPFFERYGNLAEQFRVDHRFLNGASRIKAFNPFLQFPAAAKGIYEAGPSGHINPRLLISAQTAVFKKNDGTVINDTIRDVAVAGDGITLTTVNGQALKAKKVLLSPGSFVNYLNLLDTKLVLRVKSETTIWVRVTPEEARRLSSLPSVLYKLEDPEIQDIYLIRPLEYPDGRYYLKMGANLPADIDFNGLEEVQQWFKQGHRDDQRPVLVSALKRLLPDIVFEEVHEKRCIVCYTKHHRPYIGEVDNGLFVSAGGNGYAAMSSDALGQIAAAVVLKQDLPAGFSAADFRPVFEIKTPA